MPALVTISFTPIPYAVTFAETGLPFGIEWSVTIGGTTHESTTNTISFAAPNGDYSFSIGSVSGYVASPSLGNLTVSWGASESISFTVSTLLGLPVTATYALLAGIGTAVAVVGFVFGFRWVRKKRAAPPRPP